MAKQEMRDKGDGQGSGSSNVPNFSFRLGVLSLVMAGLSVPLLMTFLHGYVFYAFFLGIGATVIGVVGLVFGLIGIRPIYVQRGRAVIGIILCVVSVIIGIGTFSFCFYLYGR